MAHFRAGAGTGSVSAVVGYRRIFTRKELLRYERAVAAAKEDPAVSPALLAALIARVSEYQEDERSRDHAH